jgi:pimeloyl-ACP methyl ester carboxylesterase
MIARWTNDLYRSTLHRVIQYLGPRTLFGAIFLRRQLRSRSSLHTNLPHVGRDAEISADHGRGASASDVYQDLCTGGKGMRVILIHGAWQGSWAWNRLLPALAGTGIRAEAIDLPGNGTDSTPPNDVTLDLYVEWVGKTIRDGHEQVHLIGHSGGGVFRRDVCGVVYVAGIMLPDGGKFGEVVGPLAAENPAAAGIRPHLVWSQDELTSTVPANAAREIFFHDCCPDDARQACDRLSPQPEGGRAISPRLTSERFGTVPRLYVEARHDRSVVLAAQRQMQSLVPGADVVCLDSGHVPQLSMPGKLADCVIPWLMSR